MNQNFNLITFSFWVILSRTIINNTYICSSDIVRVSTPDCKRYALQRVRHYFNTIDSNAFYTSTLLLKELLQYLMLCREDGVLVALPNIKPHLTDTDSES